MPSIPTPIYSDRFIPSRSGSNFSLFDAPPASSSSAASSSTSFNGYSGKGSSGSYSALLRELLFESPLIGGSNRNIFRFKAERQWPQHEEFDGLLPRTNLAGSRKFPESYSKVMALWIGLVFSGICP